MDKKYDHQEFEAKIYKLWEKSGAFKPSGDKENPFTIIMPPPNSNDPLHVGHARFVTVEDILARFKRMQGFSTLWLPGSDHAGIETQYVFEKRLQKKGKSRFDYSREKLYQMIWDYVMENSDLMESQLKKLGASCDWSRHKFTLDPDIVKIVNKTFKKLHHDGLLYRGERIVNYCPKCGTSFSELEVDHIEKQGEMYYINYGPLIIATVRPETIFADVAIAVNPKDDKYKKLIGKKAIIPLVNREIPIIADSLVDKDIGTGVLKVTPGHDPIDFEIGQKHKLPVISVIDEKGKMINTPAKYSGIHASRARKEIVSDLEKAGKLEKTKNIKHVVSVCYRDGSLIEPTVSKQWFIKVTPLAKKALASIKSKSVKFNAIKYEKMAKHWLKNLKDWNISRQIVWGIRIPAWRCEKCLEWEITDGKVPTECSSCNHDKLTQDTDTFDTWFSSGQWPFATLKTNKPGDFEQFYPTSVMNTGYDIIPFWVIRMIMLGLYSEGKVPFKNVVIHGLVRDSKGKKISKSKGNVIDPIEMVEKYGADSLRMALVWGALLENDIALSEDNIRGQRNFANKLWNIARFVFMEDPVKTTPKPRAKTDDDKKILTDLTSITKRVTRLLDKYHLNEAAEELYNFVWNNLASDYLEKTKSRRPEAQKALEYVLQQSLKLLHPFMPFVTETIWQEGKNRFDSPTLISASWPK